MVVNKIRNEEDMDPKNVHISSNYGLLEVQLLKMSSRQSIKSLCQKIVPKRNNISLSKTPRSY
jgi:hypothetical protein